MLSLGVLQTVESATMLPAEASMCMNVPAADVLAGRKTVGTISGQILFAGQHASRTFLRRYTGYVEQFGESPPAH